MGVNHYQHSIGADPLKPSRPHQQPRYDTPLDIESTLRHFVEVRSVDHVRMEDKRVRYFSEHSSDWPGIAGMPTDLRPYSGWYEKHHIELVPVFHEPWPKIEYRIVSKCRSDELRMAPYSHR